MPKAIVAYSRAIESINRKIARWLAGAAATGAAQCSG